MKIIITESMSERMFNLVYNYIDTLYDWDEVRYFDEENYDFAPIELIDYEENVLMRVYMPDYWTDITESGIKMKEDSPMLDLGYELQRDLKTKFGPLYKEPLKKWFEDNYGIKIKSVDMS
jgi:hypothetical protein